MDGAPRFIVVELPSTGLTATQFTLEHPYTTLDVISEPAHPRGAEVYRQMLFMIREADRVELDDLLGRMARSYGKLQPLRDDVLGRVWIGRGVIRQSDIKSEAMQRVLAFQDRFGAPWFHAQGGVVHVRAIVTDAADAEPLAQDMRAHLAETGVEAQVDVQAIGAHDYSVWDELVQFSIGVLPPTDTAGRRRR